MTDTIIRRKQSTELVKLSETKAQKILDDSLSIIEELRPVKPEWLWDNHKNGMMPFKEADFMSESALLTFLFSVMGTVTGLMFSMLGPVWNADFSVSDASVIVVIGAGLGFLFNVTASTWYFLTSTYGGSKKKQPIRKMLAKLRYGKKELAQLEYRIKEYESYQQASEAHQVVIMRERQKLEEQQVFQALETGQSMKCLDEDGKIITTDKPVDEMKFDDPYKDVSAKLLGYLEKEKKAIETNVK